MGREIRYFKIQSPHLSREVTEPNKSEKIHGLMPVLQCNMEACDLAT